MQLCSNTPSPPSFIIYYNLFEVPPPPPYFDYVIYEQPLNGSSLEMWFRGRGDGSEVAVTPLADMLKQNKAVGDKMRIKTRIEAREVRNLKFHGLPLNHKWP